MSKKIAIIDHIGVKGGNHYYGLSLLRSLARLGYESWFFTNFYQEEELIKIEKVYNPAIEKSIKGLLNLLFGTLKAANTARKNGVGTIIFHLFEAGWINFVVLSIIRLRGLKIIGIAHDIQRFDGHDGNRLPNYIFNRLLDHVVVHNAFSLKELKRFLPNIDAQKIHQIKHGNHFDVINNSISKEEAQSFLQLDKSNVYALFFGQIKQAKGLEILLKAMKGTPDNLKLIIAGKPWKDDFRSYDELIKEHKLEHKIIKYIRYITDEERDYFYRAASFLILPYKIIYQSGVLLMSMSYGLPVIASDLEPNQEIILNNEYGLLFKSENIEDLNKQINKLVVDKNLQKTMSEKAQSLMKEDYHWDNLAKFYQPLITLSGNLKK